MQGKWFSNLQSHLQCWIEGAQSVLWNKRYSVTANSPLIAFRLVEQRVARQMHGALQNARAPRQHTEHGQRCDRFPAAGLTNHADDFTFANV